jgi:hypothetical protein
MNHGSLDDKIETRWAITFKGTGPKGHYVQKVPARRPNTFKRYRSEGPLRSKSTGPKGHYVQKVQVRKALGYEWLDDKIEARRAITLKRGPSEGLLCSFKIIHNHDFIIFFIICLSIICLFHDLSFHELSSMICLFMICRGTRPFEVPPFTSPCKRCHIYRNINISLIQLFYLSEISLSNILHSTKRITA